MACFWGWAALPPPVVLFIPTNSVTRPPCAAGTSFCQSARRSAELIGRNAFATAVLDGLTTYVVFAGEIFGTIIITGIAGRQPRCGDHAELWPMSFC